MRCDRRYCKSTLDLVCFKHFFSKSDTSVDLQPVDVCLYILAFEFKHSFAAKFWMIGYSPNHAAHSYSYNIPFALVLFNCTSETFGSWSN